MAELSAEEKAKLLDNLQGILTEWARLVLKKSRSLIGRRATGHYMRDARGEPRRRSPSDRGPLRIVSGRLARSLRDARTREAVSEVHDVADGIVELVYGTRTPYAATHEKGFTGMVRRRGSALYLLQIRRRAFLEPAVKDMLPLLQKIARAELEGVVRKALQT